MKWNIAFLWTNTEDAQEICNGFQRLGGKFIDQGYCDLLSDEDDESTGLYAVVLTFTSTKETFYDIYHSLKLTEGEVKWVLSDDICGLPGLMAR